MKTFKDIVSEVAQPLAGDEKRFKEKHKVDTIGDPQNNGDKLYKGSEIKKDKTKKASYEDGEDSKVYEEVDLEEGMRLIATHTAGPHSAKVYKDTENDEHRVKFFKNGQHQKDGDYHTDDKEDANSTAKYQLKKWHSTNEEVEIEEGIFDKKPSNPLAKKNPVQKIVQGVKDRFSKNPFVNPPPKPKMTNPLAKGAKPEMDEAKGEDAYYARYGAGGKKKSPEEVASDKKAAAIKKDRESYSKMRKDLGTDDYATTKKIVGEKIDVYAAMKARYGKDFKKKSPEEVAADKEKEVKKKSEMSKGLEEKKLTPAEMKKREEVAKAIERENPNMPMGKKMAIATATAKKVAESINEDIKNKIAVYRQDGSFVGLMNNFSDAQKRYPGHVFHSIQTKPIKESVAVKEDYDAEGEMAKTELRAIAHKALQLHSMMEDDDQLESWLQSKITKAKYMIDSVYDYIAYNMPDDEDDEPAEDYMSALPYPNRPVGGMYGEDVNENVYNIKPTSVDKGIAAASAEYIKRKKEGTLPMSKPEPSKKPSPEADAKYQAWLKKKEAEEAKEKAAARKTKTEEVESIDETSAAKAQRYLDAQDKELASGKVATEGPRKSINRMVGYSRAKEKLSPKQMLHLDKNKNNKIDAQDFELLRKEKNK